MLMICSEAGCIPECKRCSYRYSFDTDHIKGTVIHLTDSGSIMHGGATSGYDPMPDYNDCDRPKCIGTKYLRHFYIKPFKKGKSNG